MHKRENGLHNIKGWDHGVFVPLLLIAPEANIPVLQVSVLASQSAADLLKMGTALSALREKNIAILGSGSASFHNLRSWFSGGTQGSEFKTKHAQWAAAVDDAVSDESKLADWRKFPHAYDMHPRGGAEHFSPLVVCVGACKGEKPKSYIDNFMGVEMKTYYWVD